MHLFSADDLDAHGKGAASRPATPGSVLAAGRPQDFWYKFITRPLPYCSSNSCRA